MIQLPKLSCRAWFETFDFMEIKLANIFWWIMCPESPVLRTDNITTGNQDTAIPFSYFMGYIVKTTD